MREYPFYRGFIPNIVGYVTLALKICPRPLAPYMVPVCGYRYALPFQHVADCLVAFALHGKLVHTPYNRCGFRIRYQLVAVLRRFAVAERRHCTVVDARPCLCGHGAADFL